MPQRVLLHFSPNGRTAPPAVLDFAEKSGHPVVELKRAEDLALRMGRVYPAAVIIDASSPADGAISTCRTLKCEAFTAVIPVVMYSVSGDEESVVEALEAGADEVLTDSLSPREFVLRIRMALWRAERDVSVHPTTLLPGTVQIERDITRRLEAKERFAVCYVDLDHFKEFNDRYGYNNGDRVILILSRILREIVRSYSADAFVGHIGGDDFIFTAPLAEFEICCEEVITVFKELIPLHYEEEDRERGCFLGKDRRGEMYSVPLMTLSIGVVTNQHRTFEHPAQISELATEMKAYAKTLPGSLYVVDRRLGAAAREA